VNHDALFLVLCTLIAIPLSWVLPRSTTWHGIALWSAFSLIMLSPVSVAWLLFATVVTSGAMWLGDRFDYRNAVALITGLGLFAALLMFRQSSPFLFVAV
jgi:cytochrome c biogenesis protein CcdA